MTPTHTDHTTFDVFAMYDRVRAVSKTFKGATPERQAEINAVRTSLGLRALRA